jgi:hypothetical protein
MCKIGNTESTGVQLHGKADSSNAYSAIASLFLDFGESVPFPQAVEQQPPR